MDTRFIAGLSWRSTAAIEIHRSPLYAPEQNVDEPGFIQQALVGGELNIGVEFMSVGMRSPHQL